MATATADLDSVKEARRKKIQQLQASLLGDVAPDAQGSVGLPELQRVGEYSAQFGHAEAMRKKISGGLPSLKMPLDMAKRTLMPDPAKKEKKKSLKNRHKEADEELLIFGDETSSSNEPSPEEHMPSVAGATMRRSQVTDPKHEVLENIRRRHGLLPKTSASGDSLVSLTNVHQAHDPRLGKAVILDQDRKQSPPGSSGDENWPTHMPEIKSNMLASKHRDSLQPLKDSKSPNARHKKITPPAHAYPSEPPLGHGGGPQQAPATAASLSHHVSPFEEQFNRATRLPAIGKVPSIKIDAMPSRRDPNKERKVIDSRALTPPAGDMNPTTSGAALNMPTSNSSPSLSAHVDESTIGSGLVNFDHLEKTPDLAPVETFKNVPSTLEDIPSVTAEIPGNTFDAIPTDVFDAIPRAVSARHEERIRRYQSEQAARAAAVKANVEDKKVSSPDGNTASVLAHHAHNLAQTPLNSSSSPRRHTVSAPGTSLTTQSQGLGGASPTRGAGAATTVSLITALFPNAGTAVRSRQDQVESDFMFALFIQEQEQNGGGAPGRSRSASRASSKTVTKSDKPEQEFIQIPGGPPIPKPDPNDPDVGHFCAPHVPGFCEANFCVYHSSHRRVPGTPFLPQTGSNDTIGSNER